MNTKKVTYHYCTMSQISQGLSYNDGFITFTEFDPEAKGAYSEIRQAIAECSKQDEVNMIILSLSIVGENT